MVCVELTCDDFRCSLFVESCYTCHPGICHVTRGLILLCQVRPRCGSYGYEKRHKRQKVTQALLPIGKSSCCSSVCMVQVTTDGKTQKANQSGPVYDVVEVIPLLLLVNPTNCFSSAKQLRLNRFCQSPKTASTQPSGHQRQVSHIKTALAIATEREREREREK